MATLMNAVALVVALAPTAVVTLATSPSAAFSRAASPSRAALLRAAADPVDRLAADPAEHPAADPTEKATPLTRATERKGKARWGLWKGGRVRRECRS